MADIIAHAGAARGIDRNEAGDAECAPRCNAAGNAGGEFHAALELQQRTASARICILGAIARLLEFGAALCGDSRLVAAEHTLKRKLGSAVPFLLRRREHQRGQHKALLLREASRCRESDGGAHGESAEFFRLVEIRRTGDGGCDDLGYEVKVSGAVWVGFVEIIETEAHGAAEMSRNKTYQSKHNKKG